MAEDPQKVREHRVAELRDWAMEAAPLDWSSEQRDETSRAVEVKLSYLSDDVLAGDNMKKYVENIVRTKEMFYAARHAEEDYLRRHGEVEGAGAAGADSYPYEDSEENG